MGKAKRIGGLRQYIPNAQQDRRRTKLWARRREYTDRHEEVIDQKRSKKEIEYLKLLKAAANNQNQ